jgi:Domain of unknown function (DUF4249)
VEKECYLNKHMTFQTLRLSLLALNCCLLFANCVKEINFSSEQADLDTLVVDGRFTNLDETHILRLTRPGNYNKQRFEPVRGATITLSDDQGQIWNYQEINRPDTPHWYYLDHVQGVPGRSYTLNIRLADGTEYSANPQKMPDVVPLDTFYMTGKTEQIVNSNGIVTSEKYALMEIASTVPTDNKDKYLRWDAFSVHLFYEIAKIYYFIPPPQKQCFFTVLFNGQNIALSDLSKQLPGTALRREVAKKKIDQSFEFRIYFNAYQYSMTKEAHEYWRKVNALINQDGTIFDTAPAPVFGNVYRDGDPKQATQGFFEICAADVKRASLTNGELGLDYSYYPSYCTYDWSTWPPVNHLECDDCTRLAGSTLSKPWYW